MIDGVLIAESIRPGQTLEPFGTVTSLTRWKNPHPAVGQPEVWTIMAFQADTGPDELAKWLSDALDGPGWYADFQADGHKYVVYPGRIFNYVAGDPTGRADAIAYGRTAGVPDEQLDWSE